LFVNDEFGSICEKELSITDIINIIKKLKDNKSPGNEAYAKLPVYFSYV